MKNNFIDLYDKYFDDIYRYIYLKVGNKWDTDDLTSITFRKAFENFKDKNNTKTWLFVIAKNTVIDYYRKVKDISIGDDLDLNFYPEKFEENIEKREEINNLKILLLSLEKEDLELINLRYYANLKYKEIANLLNKSEASIKMKIKRILKKLGERNKEV